MRRLYVLPLLLLLVGTVFAGTPGRFRGTIVDPPAKAKTLGRWIYVKGKNGMLRRVEISKAKVRYDESVPKSSREQMPDLSLKPGAEVRVTAEQDGDGEWRASEIELLGSSLDDYELPPGHPKIDPTLGINSKI